MSPALAIGLNALALYGIAFVLAAAFAAQLILHELPCPLCLLQRLQFALLAIGPMLTVRHGPRPSHYAVTLLAAAAGAAFSMRQILLHILPGVPGYGSPLFGYHFYTWAFFGFAAAIVLAAAMLLFEGQFKGAPRSPGARPGLFARGAVWLVIGLTALNVVSALLECGFAACPDNPLNYELLRRLR